MSRKQRYVAHHKPGDTPWEVGRPDFNLIEVVTGHSFPPDKALDVGHGSNPPLAWRCLMKKREQK